MSYFSAVSDGECDSFQQVGSFEQFVSNNRFKKIWKTATLMRMFCNNDNNNNVVYFNFMCSSWLFVAAILFIKNSNKYLNINCIHIKQYKIGFYNLI